MKTTLLKTTTIALALAALAPLYANAAGTGSTYLSIAGEYIASAKADGKLAAAGGVADLSSDFADGAGGILALGYYLSDNIRAEAEASYRQLNGDTTSVTVAGTTYTVDSSNTEAKAFAGMVNLYLNIPTESAFSPYIGGGIGWAREQEEGSNAFAYQLMAGLDYKLSENGTLFAGYRYFGTGDFENKYNVTGLGQVTETASVQAHGLDIGYRINF